MTKLPQSFAYIFKQLVSFFKEQLDFFFLLDTIGNISTDVDRYLYISTKYHLKTLGSLNIEQKTDICCWITIFLVNPDWKYLQNIACKNCHFSSPCSAFMVWGHHTLLMHLAIECSVFGRYPQDCLIVLGLGDSMSRSRFFRSSGSWQWHLTLKDSYFFFSHFPVVSH